MTESMRLPARSQETEGYRAPRVRTEVFCVFALRLLLLIKPATPENRYGVRSRRTRLLEDQLDRAHAGSWQIADRYATAS